MTPYLLRINEYGLVTYLNRQHHWVLRLSLGAGFQPKQPSKDPVKGE